MAQVEKIHAHSVRVSEVETYTDINKVYDSYNFVVDIHTKRIGLSTN